MSYLQWYEHVFPVGQTDDPMKEAYIARARDIFAKITHRHEIDSDIRKEAHDVMESGFVRDRLIFGMLSPEMPHVDGGHLPNLAEMSAVLAPHRPGILDCFAKLRQEDFLDSIHVSSILSYDCLMRGDGMLTEYLDEVAGAADKHGLPIPRLAALVAHGHVAGIEGVLADTREADMARIVGTDLKVPIAFHTASKFVEYVEPVSSVDLMSVVEAFGKPGPSVEDCFTLEVNLPERGMMHLQRALQVAWEDRARELLKPLGLSLVDGEVVEKLYADDDVAELFLPHTYPDIQRVSGLLNSWKPLLADQEIMIAGAKTELRLEAWMMDRRPMLDKSQGKPMSQSAITPKGPDKGLTR